jgi:hypothetical protein
MKHILIALSLFGACAAAQNLKVGVIEKSSLVVAYYGSPAWQSVIKAKMAEQQAARQAGDKAKADELEKWGQAQQEKAHQQLAGQAPVDNIVEMMKAGWPEIARRAGVAMVVMDAPFIADGVEKVDVTPQLLDYLSASERVRKWVADLKKPR